jgi:hypothetical protein
LLRRSQEPHCSGLPQRPWSRGPVKSGKQALAKLPQASDCHIDLHGTFADAQAMEASGIDVCADKTLNLTD